MTDDEVTEWILVEDPPDHIPVPIIRTTGESGAAAQPGTLIMSFWSVAGTMEILNPEPPYTWPNPLPIRGDTVTIDLGTSIAPVEVETRITRTLDSNGLPDPPASARWCTYREGPAECRITLDSDDENWVVKLTLPPEPDTFFISMRGTWALPIHSAFTNVPEGTTFDAAWLFAVDNT